MTKPTCPMSALQVLDASFMENRARLLEVAAFLDRIDRAQDPELGRADFRYQAIRDAIAVLQTASEQRARGILLAMSDPTTEPLEQAGSKGASGAWSGRRA